MLERFILMKETRERILMDIIMSQTIPALVTMTTTMAQIMIIQMTVENSNMLIIGLRGRHVLIT